MNEQRMLREFSIAISLILLSGSILLALARITPALQNPANTSQVKQKNSQDDVLRVETNLVTVPASVMDRDGRYITDLKKEDFQIFEDGVKQEVAFFSPVEQPFTILFLLDVSGSMGYKIGDLASAANAFVGQLRPDDQLIVASFEDWVQVLCELTSVREVRQGKQFKLRAGRAHDTMVYEAVDYALKRMRKINGRKAIVLFSDALGEIFVATPKDNLRDAEEQDALIYTVQFNTYPTILPPGYGDGKKQYYEGMEAANRYMRELAQKTGGRYYQLESISDLGKTFGVVADELRRQYSLGYYPKNRLEASQRREIKVKVHSPNLVVRARDSYIVESSKKKRQR